MGAIPYIIIIIIIIIVFIILYVAVGHVISFIPYCLILTSQITFEKYHNVMITVMCSF